MTTRPDPVEQDLTVLERRALDFLPLASRHVDEFTEGLFAANLPLGPLGTTPAVATPLQFSKARAFYEGRALAHAAVDPDSCEVAEPFALYADLLHVAALALYQIAQLQWDVDQEREAVSEAVADLAERAQHGALTADEQQTARTLRARLRALREIDTTIAPR